MKGVTQHHPLVARREDEFRSNKQGSKLTSCICVQGKFGFCGLAISYPTLLEDHSCVLCIVMEGSVPQGFHTEAEGNSLEDASGGACGGHAWVKQALHVVLQGSKRRR